MGEKRRQFTREFKLEAVRMIASGERKLEELARDLGVDPVAVPPFLRCSV
jgi:transposase-like protein